MGWHPWTLCSQAFAATFLRVAHDIRVGEPAPGIVMATADHAGDLVVMATPGRTGFGRAVMGSMAGAVVRTGVTPVLLARGTIAPAAPILREIATTASRA